jgi:branched-chain amino acid transport system ATP-binding protein
MKHILNIKNLSMLFGGVSANKNVSFDVQTDEILGLIGPNGAGKTTLFNCISGYYPPTSGDVIFEGRHVVGHTPDYLCRVGMCRTWQKVKPLSGMSVAQNVMIGAFSQTNSVQQATEIAYRQLSAVGLVDRAEMFASALSIGEKKKLEVARALATSPKLLLLDEICGGLNQTETEDILILISDIRKKGVSVIFIEHDMKAVISICDRVVVLNSGEKIAEGKPSDVMRNRTVITAYLGDEEPKPCSK